MLKFKPFYSYQGGKKKEIPIIINHLPETKDKIIDVFGGGGSVVISLLSNNIFDSGQYNDINPKIVKIWDLLYNKPEELDNMIKNYPKMSNEEIIKFIKTSEDNDNICDFLARGKYGFRGIRSSKTIDTTRELKNISEYFDPIAYNKKYLENIDLEITNLDFKDVMNKYKDDETAFLYLDPPYVSDKIKEYQYCFTVQNINWIYDFMESCKCKVMLNIDYTGFTREKFNKFFKYAYNVKYDLNADSKKKAQVYDKYHLILANY